MESKQDEKCIQIILFEIRESLKKKKVMARRKNSTFSTSGQDKHEPLKSAGNKKNNSEHIVFFCLQSKLLFPYKRVYNMNTNVGDIIGLEEGWERIYEDGISRLQDAFEEGMLRKKLFSNKDYSDIYTYASFFLSICMDFILLRSTIRGYDLPF